MNRRDLLNLAVAAGATSGLLRSTALSDDVEPHPFRIIDTNVSLFRWPFRRLPLDDTEALVNKLRSLGFDQAWAGTFEGILHRDLTGANRRLFEACRTRDELIPMGSINPKLPDWEYDLQQCVDDYAMPGIRLHPNYHGYTLDDPVFGRLLELATGAGCFVQIAVAMEDSRTQHARLRVPDVDLTPLSNAISGSPGARVQLLNVNPRQPLLKRLAETSGVYFDTARVDGTDGVPQLVQNVPTGRVLFGSHAPLLIPEAALIRIHESGVLDEAKLRCVYGENAVRFSGSQRV